MLDLSATSFCVPLIDKHSPIALSIISDVHWNSQSSHTGIETTLRQSHEEGIYHRGTIIGQVNQELVQEMQVPQQTDGGSSYGSLFLTQASPLHRHFTTPNSTSVDLTRLSHHTTREPQLKFGWLFTAAAQLLLLSLFHHILHPIIYTFFSTLWLPQKCIL